MPRTPRFYRAVQRRPNKAHTIVDRISLEESTSVCCDICWFQDGNKGMKLYRCVDCGVAVHLECYGYFMSSPSSVFRCWACRAVGTTVHAPLSPAASTTTTTTGQHQQQQRLPFTTRQRPTECCLCSVDNGSGFLHAMHPIYDNYGLGGRQIVLPATTTKSARLAWAHTLCCLALCILTHSCVYGCTQEGCYDGVEDENKVDDDDDDDNVSVNSTLAAPLPDDIEPRTIHHYAYVIQKPGQPDDDYTRRIRLQQTQLRCSFCGLDDKPEGVYRIPIQCCANDEDELEDFRETHRKTLGDDTCYVAMHVGCAVWRKEVDGHWPRTRRVFFYPGHTRDGEEYPDPVCHVFCHVHALELEKDSKGKKGTKKRVYPGYKEEARKLSTTANMAAAAPVVRRNEDQIAAKGQNKGQKKIAAKDKSDTTRDAVVKGKGQQKTASKGSKVPKSGKAAANKEKADGKQLATKAKEPPKSAVVLPASGVPTKKPSKATSLEKGGPNKVQRNSSMTASTAAKAAKDHNKNETRATGAPSQTTNSASSIATGDFLPDDTEASPGGDNVHANDDESASTAAAAGSAATTRPPVKRARMSMIKESKLQKNYNPTDLEKKFLDVVADVRSKRQELSSSSTTTGGDPLQALSQLLERSKPKWKNQLKIPQQSFTELWKRVEQSLMKDVQSEVAANRQPPELPPEVDDWSFLVVGRNYKSRELDWTEWDTHDVLTSEPNDSRG